MNSMKGEHYGYLELCVNWRCSCRYCRCISNEKNVIVKSEKF